MFSRWRRKRAASTAKPPSPSQPLPWREIKSYARRKIKLKAHEQARNAAAAATSAKQRLQRAVTSPQLPILSQRRRTPPREPELVWLRELTFQHAINCEGRQIERLLTAAASSDEPWAASSLLPVGPGQVSWKFRVRAPTSTSLTEGRILCLGICDAKSTCAWGVDVCSGRLLRCSHLGFGMGVPPPGFPDEHGRPVFVDRGSPGKKYFSADGRVIAMRGSHVWNGGSGFSCTVELVVDYDEGTLSCGLDSNPPKLALRGLPRQAALRAWAHLPRSGDQASLEPNWSRTAGGLLMACMQLRSSGSATPASSSSLKDGSKTIERRANSDAALRQAPRQV